ncbi:extracellular solute-binding protein [Streptomyces aurantiacus]|uniref:Sugar ABC transporter substrate-binding protein n=1 Tax=Streptomyces aurantiacus TaxID=47760 RepID=A0A7G1PH57_9ACTN|nr:extracellular solute-binding protein [Streptomyces aurantiacus]BCL32815.1 sugar ABC transporter substrate-binding protein [Streptomyces aurantiacus]
MDSTQRVRHRIAATVCAVALVLPLTACEALTPGSATAVPGPTSVPSSTAVPDGDVTLRLQFADAPLMVDALIAAFEKEHPHIGVEPQYKTFSDYVQNLKLTMTSDTAPDIAQYAVGMTDLAADGHILDLAPYREAYGWDDAIPPVSLDQLTAGRTSEATGGRALFGVPAGLSMTGIYYNKELAEKAGIGAPPTTLAEFEKQLAAAKNADLTPLGVGALDSGGLHLWAALLNQLMPTDEYWDWVNGKKGATMENPAAVEASELMVEWGREGYYNESANGTAQVDSTAQFAKGDSVFLINGNWAAGQLATVMGDNVGFFPMPGEKAGSPTVASGFSVSYAVSSKTEHPQAAGAFLDFLTSPEAGQIISDNGFLPPNPEAVKKPAGVLADIAEGHRRAVADDGITTFPDFAAPAMLDRLRSGVQKLIADRVAPAEYLDSLQDEWEDHHGE